MSVRTWAREREREKNVEVGWMGRWEERDWRSAWRSADRARWRIAGL
jgi:hypothetical protein